MTYSCFEYDLRDHVAHVTMCRGDDFNTMSTPGGGFSSSISSWANTCHGTQAIPNASNTLSEAASSRRKPAASFNRDFTDGGRTGAGVSTGPDQWR